MMSSCKKDGYASSVGGSEAGISAIALPIQGGGPVLGSLNLIFFSSSMTPEVAARRYLANMKQAVKEIERRWAAANKARGKVT
jgi:IclR family mhp operon transcriptional activator